MTKREENFGKSSSVFFQHLPVCDFHRRRKAKQLISFICYLYFKFILLRFHLWSCSFGGQSVRPLHTMSVLSTDLGKLRRKSSPRRRGAEKAVLLGLTFLCHFILLTGGKWGVQFSTGSTLLTVFFYISATMCVCVCLVGIYPVRPQAQYVRTKALA